MFIRKAIFPVAGLGTRFLPATKANPKEMLPIVDKPLIQFAAEEAVRAGISELVFVTSGSKRAIEDHFDRNVELEAALSERNQLDRLAIVKDVLPEGVSVVYIRQQQPKGLGHAIACAQAVIGDEPFAVLLADDLITGVPGCISQMVELYERMQSSIVAVEQIKPSESNKYGIVDIKKTDANIHQMHGIVEKPNPEAAPSNLAAVGRYVLTPRIFKHLNEIPTGCGNEIQLTDAIAALLHEETVYAFEFDGTRYDCGSKLGYLKAMVHYGKQHVEVGQDFSTFLAGL